MTDLEALALCVWKEARGEGENGMRAVAHVIMNRVGKPGFGNTIQAVIFDRNQFTSMSVPSDPEYDLEPQNGDPQYEYCETLAQNIGTDPDLTNGALYYANLKNVTSGWFERVISGPNGEGTPEHPLLATVGEQSFFA